jgi:hypothetical protein
MNDDELLVAKLLLLHHHRHQMVHHQEELWVMVVMFKYRLNFNLVHMWDMKMKAIANVVVLSANLPTSQPIVDSSSSLRIIFSFTRLPHFNQ